MQGPCSLRRPFCKDGTGAVGWARAISIGWLDLPSPLTHAQPSHVCMRGCMRNNPPLISRASTLPTLPAAPETRNLFRYAPANRMRPLARPPLINGMRSTSHPTFDVPHHQPTFLHSAGPCNSFVIAFYIPFFGVIFSFV
jgi:hypothetical protein